MQIWPWMYWVPLSNVRHQCKYSVFACDTMYKIYYILFVLFLCFKPPPGKNIFWNNKNKKPTLILLNEWKHLYDGCWSETVRQVRCSKRFKLRVAKIALKNIGFFQIYTTNRIQNKSQLSNIICNPHISKTFGNIYKKSCLQKFCSIFLKLEFLDGSWGLKTGLYFITFVSSSKINISLWIKKSVCIYCSRLYVWL